MQPRMIHTVRPLTHALPDHRNDAEWVVLQSILYPDPSDATVYRERGISPDFFCPITGLLMHSPVRDLETNVVFEKEAHQQLYSESATRNAVDLSRRINVLLQTYSYLKSIQYLPFELIDQMSVASRGGNEEKIYSLMKLDQRLLTTFHPETQRLPLHEAILNQRDLGLHVKLLEKYHEGLALAVLLTPDTMTNQLPLEMALRSNPSMISILKLIAWMGDAMDSFKLCSSLSVDCQEMLNNLLLVYTLSGNQKMIEKMIALGADVRAPLPKDQDLWKIILSFAKPEVIQLLTNKIAPKPLKEASFSEALSSPRTLQLKIVMTASDSAEHSQTERARSTNGTEILLQYETIKNLVATLTNPLLNEKMLTLDNVDVSFKDKAVSRAVRFERKPSKSILFSLSEFFDRSISHEDELPDSSQNASQTDLAEGDRISGSCYKMVCN